MSPPRVLRSLIVFLAIASSGMSLSISSDLSAQDAGDGASAEPSFKSEKYEEAFAQGRKLFEEGDYKGAAKSFKSAERGAKSKDDKALVKSWGLACKAGATLVKVERMRKANLWNEAYNELLSAMQRYGKTPIRQKLGTALKELDSLLFHPLENFNIPNPRKYSKKYGKLAITDPKLQVNGTNCLHWQSVKGQVGQLKIEPVPANWGQYQSLEFWVRVRTPAKAEAILMSVATRKKGAPPPPPTLGGGKAQPILAQPIVLGKAAGWSYMRLDLSKFKAQAGADIARVKSLLIQFPMNKTFDFYLDEIRLRKKNPKTANESSPAGRRR